MTNIFISSFKKISRYLFPLFIFSYIILMATWEIEAKKFDEFEDNLQKVTLQLPWMHQFQFAGYYAAVEKGYYKDAGFRVDVIEGKPGLSPVDEIISKRVTYGVARSEILLHRLHGKPIIVLAAIMQHSALVFLSKKETGISSPHDMIGHRVMMLKGDDAAEYIAMFHNEGISVEQIKIIPSSYDINDLVDGNTDVFNAYSTNEPYYFKIKNIPTTIISPINYGIDFYGDCLFTSERELKKNPSRVKAFRAASIRGWEYAMAHPEEIINVILTQYGSTKTREHLTFEANSLRKLILPDLIQLGHMNPGRWHHMADTYVELGMADAGFSLEGFIYDPNPYPDYRWMKWTLGAALFLILLIGLGFFIIYFHNKRLQREINQRIKSENALRESEERFKQIYEHMSVGVATISQEFQIKGANKAYCCMLGYREEELIGRHLRDITHPEILKENLQKQSQLARGEINHYRLEKQFIHKNGNIIHGILNANLVRNSQGKPLYFLGSVLDITARKKMEKALQDSEEKYRSMMESMKDTSYICSPELCIEYMNPAMIDRVGTDATGELCYKAIYDREKKCSWCVFDQVKKGEQINYEVADPKNNRYYSVSNSPIFNNDGTVSKLTLFHDITEIKNIEAQLRQSRKMESIGTLAGGIAHDFNNLLYMISGNAELALEDIPKWNPAYTNLEEIKSASLRAAGIVKQLLNFSRKTDRTLNPIGAVTVIEESLKFLRSTIPTTIEIHKHLPKEDITIIADPVQINQVMMNLCINSSQSMEDTGGILEINVELASLDEEPAENHPDPATGDCFKITVSDTGPGIAPEIIERIFDPYFTTKKMEKGSGMGLSIVHGIVKNHGGTISVSSKLGKGTTFTILFPVVDKKPVHEPAMMDKISRGHETILFVDDEKSIADMAQRMLKRLGYKVEISLNPLQALNLFQSKPDFFHLVITDMTMPQMTGADLSEKLLEIRSDIPIIICTGHSALIDEKKATQLGIAGYVMKPISMSEIAKTIRTVLDK